MVVTIIDGKGLLRQETSCEGNGEKERGKFTRG
jgi:hypothetical protein